jgi:hypothetical protein
MFRATHTALALCALLAALAACGESKEDSGTAETVRAAPIPGQRETAASPPPAAEAAATTERSAAPETPPSVDEQPEADDSVDPTGAWWTEVETTGSEVLPILDRLEGAKIRFVMRVDVSGTAPNNIVKFEFCQLQTEWIDPMDPNNITTIGFRPATVAAFSETRMIDLGGLSPGDDVPLPSLTFLGGSDESGMQVDDDSDGNPAVTAWVQTLLGLQIEVYETITIRASLSLTAPDANTLMGTVDFAADALIVSSNNVIIAAGTAVTITPDSTAVPVTVKRLPNAGGCDAVPSTIKFTAVPPPPPPLL